ncbi:histidine--tRNA ligase [Thermogymnomonas acidicola]|uniref:Histidine--tRNA ligase n=1 Tax=Thermogymnomonas acidicola TaxID=399579 RepID=A0AA37BQK1_9ARCH|nr:histidine--tRNA ligase [Thermogymnomonas acidicola]GGM67195.1 histidine--tRNA ligase [Thermogymnomonas acidicola]
MKFEHVRGFRDQYPEDYEPREVIFRTASKAARLFGYRHVDVPSVEYLDLYRVKSGDELVSQTFAFKDRGGREVTLIPEVTPSVVRMIASRKDLPRPVRWFSFPKVWRYEEPQSGRLREHFQFNADLFGAKGPAADAEVIGLAAHILDRLGLEGQYEVRVNNRKLMDSFLTGVGVKDIAGAFSVIDRFRKTSREEFLDGLEATGVDRSTAVSIAEVLSQRISFDDVEERVSSIMGRSETVTEIVRELREMRKLISCFTRSPVVMDLSIVRGLSYYTGTVFEAFDTAGELRAILGGGRYDSLGELLAGIDLPAVGFGMGDVVIEILMRRVGAWRVEKKEPKFYVCIASSMFQEEAFSVAAEIRKSGGSAVCEVSERSLSAQLKSASSEGCDFAVILGEREIEAGGVTIRDLASGEQVSVMRVDLPRYVAERAASLHGRGQGKIY